MQRLPADYYSAPASEVRPLFPRWVPLGCGSVAAVFLLIGFIGGPLAVRAGLLGKFIAMSLDMSSAEMQPMIGKDVPPAQKKALSDELAELSRNVEAEKTNLTQIQPVMEAMKTAIADKKITAAEVATLTRLAHDANHPAPKAKPAAAKPKS